jgi:hypothetical protein
MLISLLSSQDQSSRAASLVDSSTMNTAEPMAAITIITYTSAEFNQIIGAISQLSNNVTEQMCAFNNSFTSMCAEQMHQAETWLHLQTQIAALFRSFAELNRSGGVDPRIE